MIIINMYSDGSSKCNPGESGIGIFMYFVSENKLTIKFMEGYRIISTNNRMEMLSIIYALKKVLFSSKINIYTDSGYLYNHIIKRLHLWDCNNWHDFLYLRIMNIDLWKILFSLLKVHLVSLRLVKSHNSDYGNEKADFLANIAIEKKKKFWYS